MIVSNIIIFYYFTNDLTKIKNKITEKVETKEVIKENPKQFIVDIKGEIKRPGVYSLNKDDRVIDAVKKAGGFTKYADASANNLSKKVKDEMVIVIYSKDEIINYLLTKERETKIEEKCNNDISSNNSCIKEENSSDKSNNSNNEDDSKTDNNETKKLVNINTASKEELITVSGIGPSKADAIITYRKTKKFEKPEDIKNVAGIGDSTYEKIKDFITT